MSYQDIVMQVRELMERHVDPFDIAHRLHIDISLVDQIILLLSN
jgi:hypothetical protein